MLEVAFLFWFGLWACLLARSLARLLGIVLVRAARAVGSKSQRRSAVSIPLIVCFYNSKDGPGAGRQRIAISPPPTHSPTPWFPEASHRRHAQADLHVSYSGWYKCPQRRQDSPAKKPATRCTKKNCLCGQRLRGFVLV